MIPKDQCKHGYTYRIHSRNLSCGVYDSKTGGFAGIREKFGSFYLFTEFHRDNGPPYGTVAPIKEIEKCPVADIRDHLDTLCSNCQKRCEWKKTDPEKHTGVWYHLEEGDCKDVRPYGPQNEPLYEYLEGIEMKVSREVVVEECDAILKKEDVKDWMAGELRWMIRRAIGAAVIRRTDLVAEWKLSREAVRKWLNGDVGTAIKLEQVKPICEWLKKKAEAKIALDELSKESQRLGLYDEKAKKGGI